MLVAGNITTKMMTVKTTTAAVSPAGVTEQAVFEWGAVEALEGDREVQSEVVKVAAAGVGVASDGTLLVESTP
jgi:hypothetical protein